MEANLMNILFSEPATYWLIGVNTTKKTEYMLIFTSNTEKQPILAPVF